MPTSRRTKNTRRHSTQTRLKSALRYSSGRSTIVSVSTLTPPIMGKLNTTRTMAIKSMLRLYVDTSRITTRVFKSMNPLDRSWLTVWFSASATAVGFLAGFGRTMEKPGAG